MGVVDLSSFIKAYDVRGLVKDQLTPAVCRALGSAFGGTLVRPESGTQVVVGHDMRESSPSLASSFAAGVRDSGLDVVLIGLCATDQLYFASGTLDCPGAMITASHNPATYNGIKLCRRGAAPVGIDSGLATVRDAAQQKLDQQQRGRGGAEGRGRQRQLDVLADYATYLRSQVDLRGIRPLRIVVDAGNGMAGLTVPAVLSAPDLPITIHILYGELDGTFPNHEANPLDPANLVDLQQAVVAQRADAGLAFDGDADRCFLVDERGQPVRASAITALVARQEIGAYLARGVPASTISVVYTSISSRAVQETVRSMGAHAVRAKVGHSYIKEEMATHAAIFGGEHSGHYYFRSFWGADTGMLAALHVLAALGTAQGGLPLSTLTQPFDPYSHSGEINSIVEDPAAAIAEVRRWALRLHSEAVIDDFDGLGVRHEGSGADFWHACVRASNTEPLLRLNVEASDEATMTEIRDEVLSQIRGVRS